MAYRGQSNRAKEVEDFSRRGLTSEQRFAEVRARLMAKLATMPDAPTKAAPEIAR